MRLGTTLVLYSGEWRYAAHTAHTVRLPDVLLCRVFVRDSRVTFILRCFAEEGKIKRNATTNAAIREISVKTRKKKRFNHTGDNGNAMF